MELKLNIDENKLKELVINEIATKIVSERTWENREAKIGIREAVQSGAKEYIYSQKEEIINRVVEKATIEIVKKGIPRLLESLSK